MGLFDKFKKKAPETIDPRFYEVIERLKERTRTECLDISVAEDEDDIFMSKLGGLPYWPDDMAYPTGTDGKKLLLLAQLNLEAMDSIDERLPDQGMLQFFIAADDYLGMGLDDMETQKNFRVVYHESIDRRVSADAVRALGIPANTDLDEEEYFPVPSVYRMESFAKRSDFINPEVGNFDELLEEICEELYREDEFDKKWGCFNDAEFDKIYELLPAGGHKMFGYPHFEQGDPREDDYFDTLLLQIDSEGDIMWGDCGVACFFINGEALKKRDFRRVMYTWDCG